MVVMATNLTTPTTNNEPGERFLQVMSDLAAEIHTLHQPRTESRPKKVKVREPDTFDSADLRKL